jgi:hypothetical protein
MLRPWYEFNLSGHAVSCNLYLCTKTGFEFKKRRAFPIIEGVVVASENESALVEVHISLVTSTNHDLKVDEHIGLLGNGTRSIEEGATETRRAGVKAMDQASTRPFDTPTFNGTVQRGWSTGRGTNGCAHGRRQRTRGVS